MATAPGLVADYMKSTLEAAGCSCFGSFADKVVVVAVADN